LEPGLKPRLRQPIVQSTDLENGHKKIHLELGGWEQLGWALSILRKEIPNLSVDEHTLRSWAYSAQRPIDGSVLLDLKIGGQDYFRGALKSCFNLFAVNYPEAVFDKCFDAARDFIRTGEGDSRTFVRWMTTLGQRQIPRLGPIDHAIFIVSRGSSVEGVIQFFGSILHSFCLSDSYAGASIHCGYVVDPFREAQPAEDRTPNFQDDAIPVFGQQSQNNTEKIRAVYAQHVSQILDEFYMGAILRDTIAEVLGPTMGQPLTQESINQFATRLAEKIVMLQLIRR
jgi:hypothetical protein